MNIQDLFPLGWTGWISLQSKGLSRLFSDTTVQKHQFFGALLSLCSNCYPSLHLAGLSSLSHWSNFLSPFCSLSDYILSSLSDASIKFLGPFEPLVFQGPHPYSFLGCMPSILWPQSTSWTPQFSDMHLNVLSRCRLELGLHSLPVSELAYYSQSKETSPRQVCLLFHQNRSCSFCSFQVSTSEYGLSTHCGPGLYVYITLSNAFPLCWPGQSYKPRQVSRSIPGTRPYCWDHFWDFQLTV